MPSSPTPPTPSPDASNGLGAGSGSTRDDPSTTVGGQPIGGADGFEVWRQVIPPEAIERSLRVLNLEIVRRGLTPEEIVRCGGSTFFPHLRWEPDILALRAPIEERVPPDGDEQWADAQLLLRFPDEAEEWPLTSHVDDLPPWAGDRSYRAIFGVPLSPSAATNGCLVVWPGSHLGRAGSPIHVELEPGDIVVMHPALQHSGTLNKGGAVRYAVYFRLLSAPS